MAFEKRSFMKRSVIVAISIALMLGCLALFFIPANLTISETIHTNVPAAAIHRILSRQTTLNDWLKPADRADDEPRFRISHSTIEAVEIDILYGNNVIASRQYLIPLKSDSTVIHWKCELKSGPNRIERIKNYFLRNRIRDGLSAMLGREDEYFSDLKNVYGIDIKRTKVTDTRLVTLKQVFPAYPSVNEVYSMITNAKGFATKNGARQTNFAMLNISERDSAYHTMIAIPVDRNLDNSGEFLFKMMIPGNILVSEVKGGRYTIEQAFRNMQQFVDDHKLEQPAIPFQSLVTDRSAISDTTQWITRIYFPII
jgi:hypothetical protein